MTNIKNVKQGKISSSWCKICDSYTENIFNVGFGKQFICDGCADNISIQNITKKLRDGNDD